MSFAFGFKFPPTTHAASGRHLGQLLRGTEPGKQKSVELLLAFSTAVNVPAIPVETQSEI